HPVTQQFTLTAYEQPHLTVDNPPPFKVGSFGSFAIKTAGFPGPVVPIQLVFGAGCAGDPVCGGPLPPGLTLDDRRDGTAILSGTPGAGTAGTHIVSLALGYPVSNYGGLTVTILP